MESLPEWHRRFFPRRRAIARIARMDRLDNSNEKATVSGTTESLSIHSPSATAAATLRACVADAL